MRKQQCFPCCFILCISETINVIKIHYHFHNFHHCCHPNQFLYFFTFFIFMSTSFWVFFNSWIFSLPIFLCLLQSSIFLLNQIYYFFSTLSNSNFSFSIILFFSPIFTASILYFTFSFFFYLLYSLHLFLLFCM